MILAALLLLLQAPPAKETVQIPGTKITLDLVRVPAGDGLPSFQMSTTEVTWAQFNPYYANRRHEPLDGFTRPSDGISFFGSLGITEDFLELQRPVTNVRWHTAVAYCEWLSRTTGRTFRLPTEKEWEAAAKAGGDDGAWHAENSGKRTHAVAERKPNALGLYDLFGNVWEYCLEFERPTEFSPLLRGGSWAAPASQSSVAGRSTVKADWFEGDALVPRSVWWLYSPHAEQGFRVVCVPGFAGEKERETAAPKITFVIKDFKNFEPQAGTRRDFYCRVRIEVKNGTDRAIEELGVRAYYLTRKGKPHLIDMETTKPGRATFVTHWPVLPSSAIEGPHTAPLKPGDPRVFTVVVPQSFDHEDEVDLEKFGAEVMSLRFAKEDK